MRDSEFDFIRSLVYERSRISLGADKRELVAARLGTRLRATHVSTLREYCQLLQVPGADPEVSHLIDAISTNHTFFFREMAHFEFLRDTALAEWRKRAAHGQRPTFRVWSAACSSGEEPYSIAISLAESLPTSAWQIDATDISHRVLGKAVAGIYRSETVNRLPARTVRNHFQVGTGPQDGNYRVRASLRARVSFHHLNLLNGQPPFAEPFEVIFCRNVMMYFDRSTQEELVARLTRRLVPGGYLFVGHSESLIALRHSLASVQPAIYRKPFGF